MGALPHSEACQLSTLSQGLMVSQELTPAPVSDDILNSLLDRPCADLRTLCLLWVHAKSSTTSHILKASNLSAFWKHSAVIFAGVIRSARLLTSQVTLRQVDHTERSNEPLQIPDTAEGKKCALEATPTVFTEKRI